MILFLINSRSASSAFLLSWWLELDKACAKVERVALGIAVLLLLFPFSLFLRVLLQLSFVLLLCLHFCFVFFLVLFDQLLFLTILLTHIPRPELIKSSRDQL